ncbi:MAG: succinylglutamate desuccinylase/aspartoacylase family protein [Ardenticatenaceae bacterium]|nr:succinylglutamate desuccinylase/aspartoacylase family protein [Ardenticatenaceae bacterium]
MKQQPFQFADLTVAPGQRAFTWLPITRLLHGATLRLPVHILHGAEPGPVLGITGGIHGAEYMPTRMIKEAVGRLAPSALRGTVVAVPVCNPLSFARGTRISPDEEDIDFANLNRVFPGRRATPLFGGGQPHPSDRTLTETLAATITDQILSRIDHVIDFHSHFRNAGLIKTIQQSGQEGRQAEVTAGMCRAFGLGLIHEHSPTPKSMTGQAASMGVSTCVPEIGGGTMSPAAAERCLQLGVRGILNVMKYLEMIPGEVELPSRQLLFHAAPHVRPTTSGYLVSCFDPDQLFLEDEPGVPVREGETLGTLFDPYTFEDLETLRSPVDGILYITRRSGPIEAGSHAYAVADFHNSRWID